MSRSTFENLIELQREKSSINHALKKAKESVAETLALQPYESENGKVKLVTYKRSMFDTARFREENSELYSKYLKSIEISYVGVYPRKI